MLKIYTSKDDRAPELEHREGGFRTVLKACLVTGYGTKPPAGWTVQESGTASTFIPQDVSTGCRYTVSNEDADVAKITAKHDDGTPFAEGWLNKKLIDVTKPNRWVCMADGKHCWLIVSVYQHNGYHDVAAYYFGDVDTLDAHGEAGALFVPGNKVYGGDYRVTNNQPLQLSNGKKCRCNVANFQLSANPANQIVLMPAWFYDNVAKTLEGFMPGWYSTTMPIAANTLDTERDVPEVGGKALLFKTSSWNDGAPHMFALLGEPA